MTHVPLDPMDLAREDTIQGILKDVPDPATVTRQTLVQVISNAFDCGAIAASSEEVAIQPN